MLPGETHSGATLLVSSSTSKSFSTRPPTPRLWGRNGVMPGPRLVLAADDQRLANAIQTRLVQALGRPALLCRMDSCRDHLGPQADGLLLLALALPCDPEPVQYLVQEVRLQRLRPPVLVGAGPDEALQALEPHVAC